MSSPRMWLPGPVMLQKHQILQKEVRSVTQAICWLDAAGIDKNVFTRSELQSA